MTFGIIFLAVVLVSNISFRLSYNHYLIRPSVALAAALAQCPTLAHLDICNNSIGEEGANAFLRNLPSFVELTSLDFSSNDIEAPIEAKLQALVRLQPHV